MEASQTTSTTTTTTTTTIPFHLHLCLKSPSRWLVLHERPCQSPSPHPPPAQGQILLSESQRATCSLAEACVFFTPDWLSQLATAILGGWRGVGRHWRREGMGIGWMGRVIQGLAAQVSAFSHIQHDAPHRPYNPLACTTTWQPCQTDPSAGGNHMTLPLLCHSGRCWVSYTRRDAGVTQ